MSIKEKIKILSTKVVSNFWGTLEHVKFNYTFKNGETVNLIHEVYGKSDGVALLLFNKKNKTVILTKQFRMPMYVAGVNGGFSYEVCGGVIDNNEVPEQSVVREAKEEIGYRILNLEKVMTLFLSPGIVKEQVHLYIGEYDNDCKVEPGGGVASENEEIEIEELTIIEAFKMIEEQKITDARTILLLQHISLKYKF